MIKCKECHKEFEPSRADAMFDTVACRVAFNRNTKRNKGDESVTDNVTDNFIPNWKRIGLKSKDEAISKALADLALNPTLEGQVFHVKGGTFQVVHKKMIRIA
jgi:hypothetical protein